VVLGTFGRHCFQHESEDDNSVPGTASGFSPAPGLALNVIPAQAGIHVSFSNCDGADDFDGAALRSPLAKSAC
jgi:hypothetical protein